MSAVLRGLARCSACSEMSKRIAVVGGGLAGTTCAETLAKRGHDVRVFDMGRRASGGRACTRTTQEGYFFNHGLQFLRFSSPRLREVCGEWERRGLLIKWEGELGRYDAATGAFTERSACVRDGDGAGVGNFCSFLEPGDLWINRGLTEGLASHRNVEVSLGRKVNAVRRDGGESSWELGTTSGEVLGGFDAVVFSDAMAGRKGSPGHVLFEEDVELGEIFPILDEVEVKPIFALMVAFQPGAIDCEFDAATVVGSEAFQWISRENAKPNYASDRDCQSFVALSTFSFARQLLLAHPQQRNFKFVEQTETYLDPIQEALLGKFRDLVGPMAAAGGEPLYVKAQRWGGAFYSNKGADGAQCYVDGGRKLAVCGDFCAEESTAENAVLSGLACGERLAEALL